MNNHIRSLLLTVLALPAFLACGSGDGMEEKAANRALAFAHDFFNFRYVDALRHTTADSRRVLELCASNITPSIVDSLRTLTDTPLISVEGVEFANDTTAVCRINVENEIDVRKIRGGVDILRGVVRTYTFTLVSTKGGWKVRMAVPPRSER